MAPLIHVATKAKRDPDCRLQVVGLDDHVLRFHLWVTPEMSQAHAQLMECSAKLTERYKDFRSDRESSDKIEALEEAQVAFGKARTRFTGTVRASLGVDRE